MALTFQGMSKSDIEGGAIGKIEIAIQAGSYLNAGDFTPPNIRVEALSMPSDPSGSDLVYALRFTFAFNLVQTKKTAEIAAMAGVVDTGLFETDIQIKFSYISGRTLTLGSVTAYPMRALINYDGGSEDQAEMLEFSGRTIEPISSFAGKIG